MSICVPFICDASGNGACLSESIVACQCHGFRGALAYFGVLGWGRPSSCNGRRPAYFDGPSRELAPATTTCNLTRTASLLHQVTTVLHRRTDESFKRSTTRYSLVFKCSRNKVPHVAVTSLSTESEPHPTPHWNKPQVRKILDEVFESPMNHHIIPCL